MSNYVYDSTIGSSNITLVSEDYNLINYNKIVIAS